MKEFPDKYFDLAIVDVPYGINTVKKAYLRSGKQYRNALAASEKYTYKEWDKQPPTAEYFAELMRVSKNQIIWGANHFIRVCSHKNSVKNHSKHNHSDKSSIKLIITSENFSKTF